MVLSPLRGSSYADLESRACARGYNLAPLRGCSEPSELEIASGGGSSWDAFGFAGREQAYDSSQVFPCSLVQGGIGADQVADHVPRGQIKRALGRRSHGQRDGALWAKAYALRR